MLRNSLFAKTFAAVVVGLSLWLLVLYFFSVPFVNELSFDLEEKSGRTILENVYQLVNQGSQDLRVWKESALDFHKRELRNITSVVESYIRQLQTKVARGELSKEQAQRQAIADIRGFQYGNKDYVWVSDYRSVLISHPDPELFGSDFSSVKDVNGDPIVPPMVKGARELGEGFHFYRWRRLGSDQPVEKLSYYRNIQEWEWVIGTGVYIDDVEAELARRKRQFVDDLRVHLRQTPIAKSGYMYIFDGDMHMIIHPNPNIEHTAIGDLLDPVTGHSIAAELMAAAHSPDNRLEYKWDKPSDPGHYVYAKISWVKYFPEFDWYLASSVYTEELKRGGQSLAQRLLVLSIVGLAATVAMAYLFVRALTRPIKRLAMSAERISRGDLSSKTDLDRTDELGILGQAFNTMVDKLRDQIDHLERRVGERTAELSGWVEQLERRNREVAIINSTSEWLQACRTEQEAYAVIKSAAQQLFPDQGGSLLILKNRDRTLDVVDTWGSQDDTARRVFDFDDCLSLRRGDIFHSGHPGQGLRCRHVPENSAEPYLCVPIAASGEVMGVLHLRFTRSGPSGAEDAIDDVRRFAVSLAEQMALAIANLRLRQQLQEQSVHDPLTGIFNRRYLEESLSREERRVQRSGTSLSIIMLDVDHFKKLNDRFGHSVGDKILKDLGHLLKDSIRGEDIACRYGGEEFTLLLPNTTTDQALMRAESIRAHAEREIEHRHQNARVKITLSAGVAAYPESGATLEAVLSAADHALYEAKKQGRNRVVAAAPVPGQASATGRRPPRISAAT